MSAIGFEKAIPIPYVFLVDKAKVAANRSGNRIEPSVNFHPSMRFHP